MSKKLKNVTSSKKKNLLNIIVLSSLILNSILSFLVLVYTSIVTLIEIGSRIFPSIDGGVPYYYDFSPQAEFYAATSSVLQILVTTLTSFIYFFVSYNLYKFYKNIVIEKYFEKENGKRLKVIGYGLVIYCIIRVLLIVTAFLINVTAFPYADMYDSGNAFMVERIADSFPYLFVGLMVLVIAQAFIQGNKISEENKLTV